MLAVEKHKHST